MIRARATAALVAQGLDPSPVNLAWQIPRTIRAGRGVMLGLDLLEGVTLVVVTETGGAGVVMAQGSVVIEVWLDATGEDFARRATALVLSTEEVLESARLRGIVVVREAARAARRRARLRLVRYRLLTWTRRGGTVPV